MGISITVYFGVTENANRSAVKQNFNAVVKWIKADAALCKMNGSSSTVFNNIILVAADGIENVETLRITIKLLFTKMFCRHIYGYIGVAGKNPYGSVGSDRACDIWKRLDRYDLNSIRTFRKKNVQWSDWSLF